VTLLQTLAINKQGCECARVRVLDFEAHQSLVQETAKGLWRSKTSYLRFKTSYKRKWRQHFLFIVPWTLRLVLLRSAFQVPSIRAWCGSL
jgi:hypothetical protein